MKHHIAFFLPDLHAGGAERVVLQVAEACSHKGFRVSLVLMCKAGPLLEEVPAGVRIVDLACTSLRPFGSAGTSIQAILRLASFVRRERPATVLSTLTGTNCASALSSFFWPRGVRLVLREAATRANVKSRSKRVLMRWLYPLADQIISLTDVIAAELMGFAGVCPERIAVIPNPVNLASIRSRAAEPFTHAWLTPNSTTAPPVICCVGRLCDQKDQTTLLHALTLLPPTHTARLLLVGDGPARKELEALCASLSLQDRVAFLGYCSNPWSIMARSALCVISSKWEGYPNVLLEALALGKRVVCTRYDPSITHIVNDQPVTLVTPNDPASLASGIASALRIPPPTTPRLPDGVDSAIVRYINVLDQTADLDHLNR